MTSVLVVDDSKVMLSVVHTYLSGLDAEIELAEGPQAALRFAQRTPPAVLITDVKMPGIDGIELARRVKRLSGGKTFVVLISGGKGSGPSEALSAGSVDAFFPKPLDGVALRRAVERAIHSRPADTRALRSKRIRVLAADDTRVGRRLLERILGADTEIDLVGVATDGREAVEMASRMRPDLVILDALMPELDGVEATRAIRSQVATRVVIVSDYLADRAVGVAFSATQVGALDVLSKPRFGDPLGPVASKFRQHLKDLAGVPIAGQRMRVPRPTPRGMRSPPPEAMVIGGSSGAPGVLASLLEEVGPELGNVPVMIAVHLLEGFEIALANWLREATGLRVDVPLPRETIVPGTVYLAPATSHLEVVSRSTLRCERNDKEPFTPSVNRLFTSAASVFGQDVMAVVLSGMGDDGCQGLVEVHRCGGLVLAQSPESCAVPAMPVAAIEAGVVDRVLAPNALGVEIAGVLRGERR